MAQKIFYALFIFVLLFSSKNFVYAKCDDFPLVYPKLESKPEKHRGRFLKKHGQFDVLLEPASWATTLCQRHLIDDELKFSSSSMFSYVIDKKCKPALSTMARNGKKVKHIVLAGDSEIIGGGEIKCIKGKKLLISNDSNQYCFDIEPTKYLIRELVKSGFSGDKILVKFKQAKFCYQKKKRLQKYSEIISKEHLDLGYKKNHIYSGTEFLSRVK